MTHPAQTGLLAGGPLPHLGGSCHREERRRKCAGGHREAQPAQDLAGVVGAGDVVEQEAAGNDIALLASRPQARQNQVAPAHAVHLSCPCHLHLALQSHVAVNSLAWAHHQASREQQSQQMASAGDGEETVRHCGDRDLDSQGRKESCVWSNGPEVADLADDGKGQQWEGNRVRWLGVLWVVDEVGDVGAEAPVVGAVLEEI